MRRLALESRLGLLAAGVSILLSAGQLSAQVGAGQVSLAVGTAAPAVTLEDLTGKAVNLQDLTRGKPALIEFWATWCEQCEALQPQINEIQSRYGSQVQVVAVAVAVAQTTRRVQQHVTEHKLAYPFLWDARGNAVRAYDAATTAIVVILDKDGKVAYTGVGPQQKLVEAMQRVLAN
jgi:thiol-disulfide isomerase/thioredoxin